MPYLWDWDWSKFYHVIKEVIATAIREINKLLNP